MKTKYSIKSYHFDWDDNLVYMPTKIIYFAKNPEQNPKEIHVSTGVFAETRTKVGVEACPLRYSIENGVAVANEHGENEVCLSDYQMVFDNELSFREFRDSDQGNYFLRDLKNALENNLLGPSWNDFVEATNCRKTAQRVTIITARGQSPETIYEGVCYLYEQGIIKNLIPIHNIYPVSYKNLPKEFIGHASNPSDAKKNVLKNMIDRLARSINANQKAFMGFSDDDRKTFDTMKEFLEELKKSGEYSNVDLNLYFTGNKTKERFKI